MFVCCRYTRSTFGIKPTLGTGPEHTTKSASNMQQDTPLTVLGGSKRSSAMLHTQPTISDATVCRTGPLPPSLNPEARQLLPATCLLTGCKQLLPATHTRSAQCAPPLSLQISLQNKVSLPQTPFQLASCCCCCLWISCPLQPSKLLDPSQSHTASGHNEGGISRRIVTLQAGVLRKATRCQAVTDD